MYVKYYNRATKVNTQVQTFKRNAIKAIEFMGWVVLVYITIVIWTI